MLDKVIERTAAASSVEELGQYFLTLTRDLGFDAASFHLLRRGLQSREGGDIPLIHSFPQDWVDYYVDNQCFLHDPVIAQAQKERRPFHWFQVNELRSLKPEEERFLSLLRDAGMTDGLAMPFFGPSGEVAYAGLGVKSGTIDLSPQELRMLHSSLYQIYNSCQSLRDEIRKPAPSLSPREREILLWVAKGKSNSVIADILSISEHTVDSLLRRIFRKLDVTSRVSAVIKAVQGNIINP